MQHACNTLHHIATHYNSAISKKSPSSLSNTPYSTLLHTATHCNTLQHTATHCTTPHHSDLEDLTLSTGHTAAHCSTLQHTAAHCSTLQHSAALCSTLQHTAAHCSTLQHTTARCSTLQHTVPHRTKPQHLDLEDLALPTIINTHINTCLCHILQHSISCAVCSAAACVCL